MSYGQQPGGWQPQPQQPYYPPAGAPPPQMNQSQPYGGAPPPQNDSYYNGGYNQQQGGFSHQQAYQGGDAKMALKPDGFEGERFKPAKPKFHDPIFLALFIAVFGGYVAISVISLRAYISSDLNESIGVSNTLGATLNGHTAVLLMLCCLIALVLSVGYLLLVRKLTTIILEVTLALSVLLNVGFAVYLWIAGNTSAAIIFTIFAVLSVVSYFFMRKRIPLAKVLLQTVIRAADTYWSSYVVAMVGLIVQTAFSVWVAWTLVATYQRFDPSGQAAGSSTSSGAVTGLVVFIIFAYYWSSEVIKNVAFTTVAGIFGVWYYNDTKPKNVALGSFKRASTYSLGSICFGSLIVAILDLLRALLNVVQQQQASEGDACGTILACVAGCCIGCIDAMVQWFNRYAYINIALYGNSYVAAAKETWTLLKQKGIDAIINDSLVNIVWTMGAYIIGVCCALFAFIYEQKTRPEYLEQSGYYAVILLFAFGLGLNIAMALGSGTIGSGVSTFFVALAEDPHVVAQRDPQLFETIRSNYPHVVNPVH
ncbi:DUF580-domain-containing protein [Violaceomyces palustris]|uniref:DUF580-domain-containing protein n=1 Tax=Violaceomyces palustris TaxID=1673888 RepID=A0ACD0NQB0_9BASI|nr:DUF580-domain-containing protein [Violaceomyces palustris]